jgi:protein involved in polysaccharide export with SLBB domain
MKRNIWKTALIVLCLTAAGSFLYAQTGAAEDSADSAAGGADNASPVEQAYQELNIAGAQNLRQFGYELLEDWQPTAKGPINDTYTVGPGDLLRIYIWGEPVDFGSIMSTYEVPVENDGKIFLQPAGRLSVWGMTLEQINRQITEKLEQKYRNFTVDTAPAEIRDISVFVSGFVAEPGIISATSVWNIVDVLGAAGGVTKSGTLRNIKIHRDDEVITVDLYDLFITGSSDLPQIRGGDIVMVPPVGNVAAAGGEVVRPAVYEFKADETVGDLLTFAGDVRLSGAEERGTLLRKSGSGYVVQEGSSLDSAFLSRTLKKGDLVLIAHSGTAGTESVSIQGQVLYPGIYSVKATPMLSDLLKKAGIRPDTDMQFATLVKGQPDEGEDSYIVFSPADVLSNANMIDFELSPLDAVELYKRESDLAMPPIQVFGEITGGITAYQEGITLLDVLSNKNIVNPGSLHARIVRDGSVADQVQLYDLFVAGNMKRNIILEPGDKVVIMRNDDTAADVLSVKVLGNVNAPGVFTISEGQRLSQLLAKAGGFSEDAFPQGLVVIRESIKEVQKRQLRQNIMMIQQQIADLSSAIAAENLDTDVQIALQGQISRQKAMLEMAEENIDEAAGRIVLGLNGVQEPADIAGTADDIVLKRGDHIYVPETPSHITVMGDLNSIIAVPHDPSKKVIDYLKDIGGITVKDYSLAIMKSNGKMVNGISYWMGGNSLVNETLDPGDVLMAVKTIELPDNVMFKQNFSFILDSVSKIATTLYTSVETINAITGN